MATQTRPVNSTRPAPPQNAVAILAPPRLAPPEDKVLAEYDVNREGWRTLTESIFPAATSVTSVMMALDYCKRRKLDVFKHPVHIVPIWNSQAPNGKGGTGAMVETIWPGINELRTTAIRTGQYAGMDVPAFGPQIQQIFEGKIKKWANGSASYETVKADIIFPEWCQITVYRTLGGNRVPFPGPRVYWLEAYARLRSDCEVPNSMWEKRANGQLEKCAEAAALRRAFPEELGSDYSIDEIGAFTTHVPADVTDAGSATTTPAAEPRREDFTNQPSPAATPSGAPAKDGQPGTEDAAGAGGDAPGKPAPVTDVEDLTQVTTFEHYKKIGDFFTFSDTFLQDPKRTVAEAEAWWVFYREYLAEMGQHKNKEIRDAVLDTLMLYDAILKRGREPGEEG